MRKNLIHLLLTLCMAFATFAFVGCDKDKNEEPQTSTQSPSTDDSTSSSEETTPPTDNSSSSSEDSSSTQPPAVEHTHNYSTQITAPTCTAQGYTTYTCTCGNTYTSDYVNAVGHSYTNYLPDGNATYEADGTKTAFCDNGCGTKKTVTDEGTKLKSGISFKTLTVQENNAVYGKVPNGTTTFSFLNEITVNGNADYTVSTDITGLNVIPTKTVPVTTGDNTFYVLEKVGNNLALYTVTVRVREIYTVGFDALGGSAVASQEVEEDSFATLPSTIPTKTGYTFDGWNFNFASTPITGDRTITANAWQANQYTVSFDGNGGSSPNGITVTYDSEYGELPTAERRYYTFLGWSTARTQGTQIQPTDVMSTAHNTTLYAVWTTDVVYSKSQDQTHYEVTGLYNTQATEICVFDEYDGLPVTAIADNLFDNGGQIKTIVLPNTITNLTQGMLSSCTALESLTLPFLGETVNDSQNAYLGYLFGATRYEENEDYVPSTLKTISLTGEITAIEQGAFLDCNELMSIILPDSVESIKEAFQFCYSLTSITIPEKVASIEGGAFYYCESLASVIIPDKVTSIGSYAFFCCNNLASVTIGKGAISIDEEAFAYCHGLKSFTVDENNPSYQSIDGVLYNKDGTTLISYPIGKPTTSFAIPVSVTTIGEYAFQACSNLTNITIPDDVTTIGSFAFSYCSNLTSIVIPNGITQILYGTFLQCERLASITIPDSVTHIYSEAFSYCYNLANITIPDRVTTIGGFAFSSCYSLKSVAIPDSVTFIGVSAFSYCTNLTSISVSAGNTVYQSIDGNLYSKDGKTLMQYAIGKTATEFIIPSGITAIKGSVFSASNNLTHITIPSSVITIDSYAFSVCDRLTSITFENASTWYYTSSYHYTDGTSISVEDANANATYFTSTYYNYYWYKEEN